MSDAASARFPARSLTLVCAAFALAFGAGSLFLSGAPSIYPVVNAGAFLAAVIMAMIAGALGRFLPQRPGLLALIAGLLLVVTSLVGETVQGATRWISLGGLTLQPSFLLLPALVVSFARAPNGLALLGIASASIALALQPDRAMAGALMLALGLVSIPAKNRTSLGAFALALAAFIATMVRPDTVPPSPFVEGILSDAFKTPSAAGVLAWISVSLLIVPGVMALRRVTHFDLAMLALAGLWMGVALAAALGNYPTPFAGYGASSVMGYVMGAFAVGAGKRAHET